jgi:hypothetical protein
MGTAAEESAKTSSFTPMILKISDRGSPSAGK